MKITVEFESIEEFEAFRVSGKATRSRKDKGESEVGDTTGGNAPAPMAPPTGASTTGFGGAPAFAPPGAGAAPQAGGFPAAAAPQVAPEVLAIVKAISERLDGAIASGQNADQALAWFRSECGKSGVDASQMTLDQIKQSALPKLPMPALQGIAKLMGMPGY